MISNISFRDPAGVLTTVKGRLVRLVQKSAVRDLDAFLTSSAAQKFIEAGHLVRTEILESKTVEELQADSLSKWMFGVDAFGLAVEQEPVPFVSYPYEWPPEMLWAAASLTLNLAEKLLREDIGLKDATPYNVLFRGPKPVFVDVLSFECRDPRDPAWLPFAQFVRTFLLPLLVNKYYNLSLDQVLTNRRDGLEPDDIYPFCSRLRRLLPPFLSLVSIPVWLSGRQNRKNQKIYIRKLLADSEKARFILFSLFKRLRRMLRRLEPEGGNHSAWSDYMQADIYPHKAFEAKQAFVQNALTDFAPQRVLDVGCNTGHFSVLAAKSGASVTAIDCDPTVVGKLWRQANQEGLNILPLVINLCRPTPPIGWRNQECWSFIDRAYKGFDAVFMLAVIHHMLITEQIPLLEIADLLAELTTNLLIIEYVGPDDPMFRHLSRGRERLLGGYNRHLFEDTFRRSFEIIRFQHLEKIRRTLYLMQKRG